MHTSSSMNDYLAIAGVLKLCMYFYIFKMYFECLNLYFGNNIWKFMYTLCSTSIRTLIVLWESGYWWNTVYIFCEIFWKI